MCYIHAQTAPSSSRIIKQMGVDRDGARMLADLLNIPGKAMLKHREWHAVAGSGRNHQVIAIPMKDLLDKMQKRSGPLSEEQRKFLLAVMWVTSNSDSGLSPRNVLLNHGKVVIPHRKTVTKTPQARRSPTSAARTARKTGHS